MKALIFGKTGQVARELQLQAPSEWQSHALDRQSADLANPASCVQAIEQDDWDVIINAAAYTAVDKAEDDETHANTINATAPGAMARAAASRNIPFLHVSTDYVFDGSGTEPWSEDDLTCPPNAYGRTKLAGETAIQNAGGQHVILRTSWVFSAHGANFVKTMLRLSESHEKLTIVADQIGGPTPARDIAKALWVIAADRTNASGLYHFGGTPAVSWADFARQIFAQAGRAIEVVDIPTSDYPTPAVRPLNSRLDCAKLATDFGITPPDWKNGLSAVLKDLGVT